MLSAMCHGCTKDEWCWIHLTRLCIAKLIWSWWNRREVSIIRLEGISTNGHCNLEENNNSVSVSCCKLTQQGTAVWQQPIITNLGCIHVCIINPEVTYTILKKLKQSLPILPPTGFIQGYALRIKFYKKRHIIGQICVCIHGCILFTDF